MEKKLSDKMQVCLIVEMKIDAHGVDRKIVHSQILGVIDQAVADGMITGTSEAELIAHKAYVSPFTRTYQDGPLADEADKKYVA